MCSSRGKAQEVLDLILVAVAILDPTRRLVHHYLQRIS
jgi:hypothetical protein